MTKTRETYIILDDGDRVDVGTGDFDEVGIETVDSESVTSVNNSSTRQSAYTASILKSQLPQKTPCQVDRAEDLMSSTWDFTRATMFSTTRTSSRQVMQLNSGTCGVSDTVVVDLCDESAQDLATSLSSSRREVGNITKPAASAIQHVTQALPNSPSSCIDLIDLDDDYADNDFISEGNSPQGLRDLELECEKFYQEMIPEDPSPENNHTRNKSTVIAQRNLSVRYPQVVVDNVEFNKSKLRAGKTVELYHGGLIFITKIIKNVDTGDVLLRGFGAERMRDLNGVFEKKQNEICCIIDIDRDDCRPISEQSVIEVSLNAVVRVRRMNVTSKAFPEDTFRTVASKLRKEEIDDKGELALRFCFISIYPSAKARVENHITERSIQHVTEQTLTMFGKPVTPHRDIERRMKWRGSTVLGGAGYNALLQPLGDIMSVEEQRSQASVEMSGSMPDSRAAEKRKRSTDGRNDQTKRPCASNRRCETVFCSTTMRKDHTQRVRTRSSLSTGSLPSAARDKMLSTRVSNMQISPSVNPFSSQLSMPAIRGSIYSGAKKTSFVANRIKGQQYTYADSFCGVGGATRGAFMAGLQVTYGFDNNPYAASAWRANFPNAIMYEQEAHNLVQWGRGCTKLKVDILHLSPPCQFFSPAHTIAGVDDDKNFAIIFACGNILDVAKPRAGTLEQTFGIMHAIFRQVFNTLICMFTSRGYSVRWKIAPLQDWGLPQRRQRLVLFFAGPGEPLPDFPAFTHAKFAAPEQGIKAWKSVQEVLKSIPRNHPLHNPLMVKKRNLPPWDATSIAPRCITTSGGQNYHPSGKRDFTLAEFAALQGFPLYHVFSAIGTKRQIGNAVPPMVAQQWFLAIKRTLQEYDGVEPDEGEEMQNNQNDSIIISDDEGDERGDAMDGVEFIEIE